LTKRKGLKSVAKNAADQQDTSSVAHAFKLDVCIMDQHVYSFSSVPHWEGWMGGSTRRAAHLEHLLPVQTDEVFVELGGTALALGRLVPR
jgi:hypothetical protein